MKSFALFPLLIVAGCDQVKTGSATETKLVEQRQVKQDVRAEIGRFQFYPGSGEMPAVLLDTATGCVEIFVSATSTENPKDVAWWRRYADVGVPLVTYENGKVNEVPDSAPPKRCEQLKALSR